MKGTLSIKYTETIHPVAVLVSKSNGLNLPLITFDGLTSVETVQNIDFGELTVGESLLFSILEHPTSNWVLTLNDVKLKGVHVYHLPHDPTISILVSFDSGPVGNAINHLDAKFEQALQFIEDVTLPEFLKTSYLYASAKARLMEVTKQERHKEAVKHLTLYVEALTLAVVRAAYPMFSPEELHSLLDQVDHLLTQYLAASDNAVVNAKEVVVAVLRGLKDALFYHARVFLIFAENQAARAKEIAESARQTAADALAQTDEYISANYPESKKRTLNAVKYVQARVEPPLSVVIKYAQDQYPLAVDGADKVLAMLKYARSELAQHIEAYFALARQLLAYMLKRTEEALTAARVGVTSAVETQINNTVVVTQLALETAQPYVHQAVVRAQPYVEQAAEVASTRAGPYIRPITAPLVAQAFYAKESLERSPVTGPLVELATKEGTRAMDAVRAYCLDPDRYAGSAAADKTRESLAM